MTRLSNKGSQFVQIGSFIKGLMSIGIIVLLSAQGLLGLLPFLPIILLLLVIAIISFEYSINIVEAFVDERYLYLKGIIKTDKIDLYQIKDVRYYRLRLFIAFERPFSVRFKHKTKFGKKIYVYPTNLDPKKKIKLNLNRKGYLEEVIKKNRA